ncbi:hypothetical protein N7450_005766 [Penicillium hetheringtonii]|uniref:Uncharacterized protein n=1 Tax=Penicillium hetheringtonii TaxID=911720 RepID=A0AAD6DKE3_9EURO|nr:hypothetical protein N7450_005766 [Penicillium hetheringtonii]
MTATLNGTFNSAPDTPSAVYPDRLIRPLPKKTLRSRLSTDTADTIHYPPTPPASQIFYGIPGDSEEAVNDAKVYVQQTIESDPHELTPEADTHHVFDTAAELESGDEDGPVVVRRSAGFRGSMSPGSSSHPQGYPGKDEAPKSSAGPDGYDAFENTNNKKKRKIPTPGNMGGHHSALSPEFASMGLANSSPVPAAANDSMGTGTYYGSGSPASPLGSGISGSGRGRLGRSSARSNSGRNPLSANAQTAWMTARTPSRRDGLMSSPGPSGDSDQGIISTAIANAASLSSPPQGPSNVSLLDQENTTPTKTQFTFTCESDSSKGMAMQRSPFPLPHRSPTSPLLQPHRTPEAFPHKGHKRARAWLRKVISISHRGHNRYHQESQDQAPLEDIWICEFCEYESIFGHPPEALIRQYEIKDRKERKRLAEKKRLLEKAKMKGRKSKKATKNSKNAPGHQNYQQGYDRASVDHSSAAGSGHPDDEYIGHEYDDEPNPIPSHDPVSPQILNHPSRRQGIILNCRRRREK